MCDADAEALDAFEADPETAEPEEMEILEFPIEQEQEQDQHAVDVDCLDAFESHSLGI